MDSTQKQNEETSLHVVHVYGVVVYFDEVSVFPAAVFLGEIIFQPFFDQSDLVELLDSRYIEELFSGT